jgi:hypothetical protein
LFGNASLIKPAAKLQIQTLGFECPAIVRDQKCFQPGQRGIRNDLC